MLTASGTTADRVAGLSLGADDYLPKPFAYAELVARMDLRPVSPRVNNVRNNGPELLAELPPEEVAEPLQLDLLAGPNPG